jgi:cell shape-determining protein MreC
LKNEKIDLQNFYFYENSIPQRIQGINDYSSELKKLKYEIKCYNQYKKELKSLKKNE